MVGFLGYPNQIQTKSEPIERRFSAFRNTFSAFCHYLMESRCTKTFIGDDHAIQEKVHLILCKVP